MDIVERLRSVTRLLRETEDMSYYEDDKLAFEAADEIERLEKENELLQKELKKHLTYQDHRHGRIGTHDPICYEYGPRHYECALREIERLRKEVDELKDLMQATVNYTGASVSSTNYTFHAALEESE